MNQDLGRSALKFRPEPEAARARQAAITPDDGGGKIAHEIGHEAGWELSAAALAIAALLIIAVLFGGGGVRYGLANLVVQLTALVILASNRGRVVTFWNSAPGYLKLMVALTIAIPLVQLIPLPPSIWGALPGRQLALDARLAAGSNSGVLDWAPITLDRARTTVALSGLIVPLTLLALGSTLPRRVLALLGFLCAGLAAAMLIPGVPQALSAFGNLSFYPEQPMKGVLFGTFANRNSAGVFLVAGLTFAALVSSPVRHPLVVPTRIAVILLIILAIILTKSRTALVLATIPMALGAARVLIEARKASLAGATTSKITLFLSGGALVAVAAIALVLTSAPGRLGDALDRFASKEDPRSYIWKDTTYAARRYWPVGSGMGTFDEVFQIDESLENITMRRAGRAHNDYLEIAVEAGLAGILLLAGWTILVAWLAWKARLSADRWTAWSGAAVLSIIALQSITDYPLRNQAMLAVAALALVLLARGASSRKSAPSEGNTR